MAPATVCMAIKSHLSVSTGRVQRMCAGGMSNSRTQSRPVSIRFSRRSGCREISTSDRAYNEDALWPLPARMGGAACRGHAGYTDTQIISSRTEWFFP